MVAVQTLDLWAARLDTARAEGAAADTLAALRGDLETLRGQLQSSPLDGAAIGRTLGRLGGQTAALDSGRVGLGGLARALTAAGRRLAPADSAAAGTPGGGTGVQ